MTPDESPKLHIDSDWKAQAQAEKERLAAQEQKEAAEKAAAGKGGDAGGPGGAGLPEANFRTLVSVLASQAIMGLGAYADPKTGRAVVDLEGARFSIDLMAVLEEKTKGNIEKAEADELTQLLSELRARFVQVSQLVAEQQAKQAVGAAAGGGQDKPSIEM